MKKLRPIQVQKAVEEWKPIAGYTGYYDVSNLGNIRSLDRVINGKNIPGKVLKACPNSGGYLWVKLCRDSIEDDRSVHSLVVSTFIGEVPRGYVIDHINNDKTDNSLLNLQIITHRENCSKDVKNKTSRFTGVSWSKNRAKWHSKIKIKGKTVNLGRFDCELRAAYTYNMKVKSLYENA